MYNESLAFDDIRRAESRVKAVEVLVEEESWADVVRESQEIVGIALKALLRFSRIDAPGIHDVSPILDQNRDVFDESVRTRIDELTAISQDLRRDRELAFYGSEDLTPADFYREQDARSAIERARFVVEVVSSAAPHRPAKSDSE